MTNLNIGIDKMGLYIPNRYLDMAELALARGEEAEKYTVGLGQEKMAVPPISQDVVSMGANAALPILDDDDKAATDLVVLATESGIDQSKAGAAYIHNMLGVQDFAKSVEMKQACYAGTAGLQLAMSHVALHPDSKALVIASDIAKYGLNSGGEPTQGAGAVAMVVSQNPRIAKMGTDSVALTREIMDFWRPNYSAFPQVKGHYSSSQYLNILADVWQEYQDRQDVSQEDFAAFIFHLPFVKLGQKGLRKVMKGADDDRKEDLRSRFEKASQLSRNVGNIYTGSLYMSLLSALLYDDKLEAGDRIGAYSYGSGAVGEFFNLELVDGFQQALDRNQVETLFNQRQQISIDDYEAHYSDELNEDGGDQALDIRQDPGPVVLAGIQEHERQYILKED